MVETMLGVLAGLLALEAAWAVWFTRKDRYLPTSWPQLFAGIATGFVTTCAGIGVIFFFQIAPANEAVKEFATAHLWELITLMATASLIIGILPYVVLRSRERQQRYY
ncbi:MAG TPA: hypothetical protein VFT87_01755 [Candidatus Saccharimonadales bacterium]|nr:hypothetical protein [Candidatus Saccharimonadales bacterium]